MEPTSVDIEMFKEMVEELYDGVFLIRLDDGKIVYANRHGYEMFGYTLDEMNEME